MAVIPSTEILISYEDLVFTMIDQNGRTLGELKLINDIGEDNNDKILCNIIVNTAYRRTGVATALLRKALELHDVDLKIDYRPSTAFKERKTCLNVEGKIFIDSMPAQGIIDKNCLIKW